MEEKNELNDIILNKGGSSAGNKKLILAVATLGVVLIIVVMLMNTLTSKGTSNLPQAILPPEPIANEVKANTDEPLFEEVKVIEDDKVGSDSLDQIAKKLKEESRKDKAEPAAQEVMVEQPKEEIVESEVAKVVPKVDTVTQASKKTKVAESNHYYIQVGSFAKYKPNKKFLNSITKLGYEYKFHKITSDSVTLNKVLVGPFNSEKEAREALVKLRSSVEAGAFLTKI